jgi:hypothetical protein
MSIKVNSERHLQISFILNLNVSHCLLVSCKLERSVKIKFQDESDRLQTFQFQLLSIRFAVQTSKNLLLKKILFKT